MLFTIHTAADYMMVSHDNVYVMQQVQVGSSTEVYASQAF